MKTNTQPTEIKTVKEAIRFLEKDMAFTVQDITKLKWAISDVDVLNTFETDEELIEYANEQKEAIGED